MKEKISKVIPKVRTLINNPRRVFWKYYMTTPLRILDKVFRPQPNFIADMSWDNLIVLDACRFDAFKKLNYIPGKLTRIKSAGTNTIEWLQKNFSGRDMKDVIYVSANPYGSYYYLHKTIKNIPFYKIVEVWKDGWSEELQTVHPSAVNKSTLESLDSHPNKRHLIHYMQPHHPFIGDFRVQGERGVIRVKDRKNKYEEKRDPLQMLRDGILDVDTVWRGYLSNLQLVLRYVKELLPNLNGKVCITSDHGNTFGRFGVFYGHPAKIPLSELIWVPWLEVST